MTPAGRNGGKVLPPAWIEVIDETDADEALAVAYAECADSTTDQTAWQRPKLAK
jgi:hypothetical protein